MSKYPLNEFRLRYSIKAEDVELIKTGVIESFSDEERQKIDNAIKVYTNGITLLKETATGAYVAGNPCNVDKEYMEAKAEEIREHIQSVVIEAAEFLGDYTDLKELHAEIAPRYPYPFEEEETGEDAE